MPLFSLHKIHLKPTDYMARGRTRACYQHPHCPNKVIKVINVSRSSWQRLRWHWRTRLEIQALKKVAKYPDIAPYFPDFCGSVRTNLGRGFVFKKVHHAVDIYQSQRMISAHTFLTITAILRRLIRLRIPFHMDLTKNVFVDENTNEGKHSLDFNLSQFQSGTYIFTLKTNSVSITKKVILQK